MKQYRYFGGFLKAQEKWLNKMAKQGYRLVRVGKLLYEFEPCESGAYQYAVDFVANRSRKRSQDYKAFLEGCGYTVFYKNANLNYAIGKIRLRPWASGSGKIATDQTTFNREILLVEKENDGRPFVLHTSVADRIQMLKIWHNIWLTYFAAFALMSALFVVRAPIASLILGFCGVVTLIPAVGYAVQIGHWKKQMEISESSDHGASDRSK